MYRVFSLIFIVISSLAAQDAVTIPELRQHITFLASDSMKGRMPGTPETRAAAAYIAEAFKKAGLHPLGENGYQYFDVITSVRLAGGNFLSSGENTFTLKEEYTPLSFSANGEVEAPLVFAGFGFHIDTDTLKWDDYSAVDVKDKWVLVLMGDPENDPHGGRFFKDGKLRRKALLAADAGAAGVLFVAGPDFDETDKLMALHYDQSSSGSTIPVLQVKRGVANTLLKGKTVKQLEKELVEKMAPASYEVGTVIKSRVALEQVKVKTQNVVAVLKGTVYPDEYVVLGAHYDHLGFGGWGSGSRKPDLHEIHNGADDNASGTASLIELAEYFGTSPHKPKRSILFMAFGAEEMGLLGSKFFTSHPLIDLKNIRIMINMDMVGRLNPQSKGLTVGGTGTARGLEETITKMARGRDFNFKASPEGFGPSDHASFYVKDIPVLFLFTGSHEDYHTPTDDVDKINFKGMKAINDFAADIIALEANSDEPIMFTEAGPKEEQKVARFKVTLGVIPDYASDARGLKLDGVREGGVAFKGGIKKGDIIVGMDNKPINNIYDYMNRLADFKAGQEVDVEVVRDGKHLHMKVTF
ncbi:MAG TPA: M28 family peptidase [Caldithrix abyssi]|uniref:M28 family peptidase n=1 Tax=Caldithrix abyssi TaxID=187145 RepID=A0A7V5RNQ6_CALAY|nr:M28 family peptidase [Caldithrix abyssi]